MGKKKSKSTKILPVASAAVEVQIQKILTAHAVGQTIDKAMKARPDGTSGSKVLEEFGKQQGFSFEYARAHHLLSQRYSAADLSQLEEQYRAKQFVPGLTLVFVLTKIHNKSARKKTKSC